MHIPHRYSIYSALKKSSQLGRFFIGSKYTYAPGVIPNLFMNSCFISTLTERDSIATFIFLVVDSLMNTFGSDIPSSFNMPDIASNTSVVTGTVSFLTDSAWTTTLPLSFRVGVIPVHPNIPERSSWRIFGFSHADIRSHPCLSSSPEA